jgi:hypothetical protein
MACRLFVLFLAIGMVVTFTYVAIQSRKDRQSSSSSPNTPEENAERMENTLAFLMNQQISTARDLYDETSPQYRAAYWISQVDAEQVPIPPSYAHHDSMMDDSNSSSSNNNSVAKNENLSGGNPFNFVQRYVLAVLYYALNGEKWTKNLHFTSDLHECSWFEPVLNKGDGDTYAMGVTCDEHLQVQNLLIRK